MSLVVLNSLLELVKEKIENNSLDKTYDKCLKYLVERPSVDYFVWTDGEPAFIEIIDEYKKHSFSANSLREKNVTIKGCASLSKDKKKLNVGEYITRIGTDGSVRAAGRDVIPSPYTSGLLDKFLDGKYVPAFETARGCPFQCTFCDQGIRSIKDNNF